MSTRETLGGWCILELMGHRRLAGKVRDAEIAGGAFIRIDIPSTPPATQFYAPGAVYCITPTTEAIARALAAKARPEPVQEWELPPRPALNAAAVREAEDDIPEAATCVHGGTVDEDCVACDTTETPHAFELFADTDPPCCRWCRGSEDDPLHTTAKELGPHPYSPAQEAGEPCEACAIAGRVPTDEDPARGRASDPIHDVPEAAAAVDLEDMPF